MVMEVLFPMTVNRVAISQPTYLPWLGYFHLMACADTFIFLDDTQFEKRSWQQRNKIKGPNGALNLTVPVLTKGRFSQAINEVEIAHPNWQKQHRQTIHHLYSRAPHYQDMAELLDLIYSRSWTRLVDVNLHIILYIADKLGLKTRFLRASDLHSEGKRVNHLIHLCQKVNATHYLSGPAAKEYIDQNNLFPTYGITLEYQQFEHPVYSQLNPPFMSHLSVLDLVMNVGWSTARAFIASQGGTTGDS